MVTDAYEKLAYFENIVDLSISDLVEVPCRLAIPNERSSLFLKLISGGLERVELLLVVRGSSLGMRAQPEIRDILPVDWRWR